MGFFTGFAITSLVVIMQSPATFKVAVWPFSAEEYFNALITSIALVATVCTFGVLSTMEVAGGMAERHSILDRFGYTCFFVGLFGLVAITPLLLIPFTEIGATLVFGVEVILLIAYFLSPSKVSQKRSS